MDVSVRATPDVDFIVHVVEVRRAAESGGQRRSPVVAILAGGSTRTGLGVIIEEREVGIVQISSVGCDVSGRTVTICREDDPVSGIGVVLVRVALSGVSSDGETPVAIRS